LAVPLEHFPATVPNAEAVGRERGPATEEIAVGHAPGTVAESSCRPPAGREIMEIEGLAGRCREAKHEHGGEEILHRGNSLSGSVVGFRGRYRERRFAANRRQPLQQHDKNPPPLSQYRRQQFPVEKRDWRSDELFRIQGGRLGSKSSSCSSKQQLIPSNLVLTGLRGSAKRFCWKPSNRWPKGRDGCGAAPISRSPPV
jgi:hypothetical protein